MFVRTSGAKKVRELGFYFHILSVHNEFPMSFNGRDGLKCAGWDTVQCRWPTMTSKLLILDREAGKSEKLLFMLERHWRTPPTGI